MVWDGLLHASLITGDSTIWGATDVTLVGGSSALASSDDDTSYVQWAPSTGEGGVKGIFDALPAGVTLGKDPTYSFYDFNLHVRWRLESDPGGPAGIPATVAIGDDLDVGNNNYGMGLSYDSGSPTAWNEDWWPTVFDSYMSEAGLAAGLEFDVSKQLGPDPTGLRITHVWIETWPVIGIPPLRQWPRDDGLRSNPKRGGVAGPVSRQGSIRRGPRGNYT
jgi:hypothetical protein